MSDEAWEPLLMHNTMRITDGHLEGFKRAIDRSVEFVERHGPQLTVQVFIDEDALVAHSFQMYPASAAVERHWQLFEPYIRDVMEHCTVERIAVQGEPIPAAAVGIGNSTAGAARTVVRRHVG